MSSFRTHPRRGLRTFVALGATGALLISGASTAFAAPPDTDSVCPAPSGNTDFPDVEGGQFEDVIECMGGYGIAGGFDDGEYKPLLNVTRGQMAKFIFNLVESGQPGTLNADAPNTFDDVADDGEFEDFISALNEAGIVDGTTADSYEPGADVTRGEMAKYIAEAINAATGTSVVDGDEPHAFDDVAEDGIFADYINALAAEDIVLGDGGDYNPGENVNRGEMSLFIMRAAEYLANNGAWEPTEQSNQAYSVTPTGQLVTAEGEERTYTADVGDAATVEVALAACDNVETTDGTVSFESSGGNADFGDAGSAEITEANGVTLPANTQQTTVDADGTFEFTVMSDDADCVLPVVFTGEGEELPVDGDRVPTNDFGVGGETQFGNVDAMSLEPAEATNPYGSEHEVTATLLNDGADDSAGTDDDFPVALDGETVEYRVVDTEGFAAITGCPSEGIRTLYDNAPANNIVAEGEATTEDGVATISYTAEDPDAETEGDSATHCILALWDGEAGSAYEGQSTEASAQKTWSDEAATPTDVTLAQEDTVNLFGDNHTVTATVTDQFDDPVAGEDVTFTVDGDEFNVTRATNDQGVATFVYQGPADPNPGTAGDTAEDTIDASTADVAASSVDDLTKTWSDGVVTNTDTTEQFPTIQGAVDDGDTDAGDTLVANGAFGEVATVDKSLTLQSEGATLAGSFRVDADTVTIDGFTISDFETVLGETAGIYLNGVADATVSNNTLEGDGSGAAILTPTGSEESGAITGNTISDVAQGVFLQGVSTFDISNNTISESGAGLSTDVSAGSAVAVTGNTFADNAEGIGLGGPGVSVEGNDFDLSDPDYTEVYIKDYTNEVLGSGDIYTPAGLEAMLTANTFSPEAERDGDAIVPVNPAA